MELFGSIKTAMIELFNDHYVALNEVVAIAATTVVVAATTAVVAAVEIRGERTFQYRYFNNTKPLEFDRVKDLIVG